MDNTDTHLNPGARKSRANWLLRIVLLIALAVLGACIFDFQTKPLLITGPMVQLPHDGGLSVVWEMKGDWMVNGAVQVSGTDGLEKTVGTSGGASPGKQRFQVAIEDVKPGATYIYTLVNRGWFRDVPVAGPFTVTTPPLPGKSFRFACFGDSGSGSNSQAELAELIASKRPDVVIHTGDLIYPAGDINDYRPKFFEPYKDLITSCFFMPSLGNHDCATQRGSPFLEVFDLPQNGPKGIPPERNYWFDYGDARFVALDSNDIFPAGVVTALDRKEKVGPWLRDVLKGAGGRWKFVYFHHPFYTHSKHAAEGAAYMKESYVDIFEECGVDVVFTGHNHLYERTAPIRKDQVMPEGQGVVYVVSGAGGAERYAKRPNPPAYLRVAVDDVFSFTLVELSATRFALKQINERNEVIDEYTIQKPGDAQARAGASD